MHMYASADVCSLDRRYLVLKPAYDVTECRQALESKQVRDIGVKGEESRERVELHDTIVRSEPQKTAGKWSRVGVSEPQQSARLIPEVRIVLSEFATGMPLILVQYGLHRGRMYAGQCVVAETKLPGSHKPSWVGHCDRM